MVVWLKRSSYFLAFPAEQVTVPYPSAPSSVTTVDCALVFSAESFLLLETPFARCRSVAEWRRWLVRHLHVLVYEKRH